jgi:hypothetical protein
LGLKISTVRFAAEGFKSPINKFPMIEKRKFEGPLNSLEDSGMIERVPELSKIVATTDFTALIYPSMKDQHASHPADPRLQNL